MEDGGGRKVVTAGAEDIAFKSHVEVDPIADGFESVVGQH